jgi:hypothetical protein
MREDSMRYPARVLTTILFVFVLAAHAVCAAEEGVPFHDQRVTDLSLCLLDSCFSWEGSIPIKTGRITRGTAELIVEGPRYVRPNPGIVAYSDTPLKDEKDSIADDPAVTRSGDSLVVRPMSAPPVVFENKSFLGKGPGEGYEQTFFYLGWAGAGKFHRVEARYGQSPPGSFFINRRNGRIVYAHNGQDLVSLSPDGERMLVMKTSIKPPLAFVVENVGLDEPVPQLYCRCRSMPSVRSVAPVFKGWLPEVGFDLVLIIEQDRPHKPVTFVAVPIRFSMEKDGWRVSAVNAPDLDVVTGLSCSQWPNLSR